MPAATTPARLHFDANAILRYLLNDNAGQADAVARKIEQARAAKVIIDVHPLVLAEVIYVLKSYYSATRGEIASAIMKFLNTPGIVVPEKDRLWRSLIRFRDTNVSFIDAFLVTLSAETSHPIFSFDRGLDKFKDIRRVEK